MSQTNNPSIAQRMEELRRQVAWFEGDDFTIDEAMERYKIAEQLAEGIEKDLAELKNEVVVLKQKFDQ